MGALKIRAADYQTMVVGQPDFGRSDKIIAACLHQPRKKAYMGGDLMNPVPLIILSDKVQQRSQLRLLRLKHDERA